MTKYYTTPPLSTSGAPKTGLVNSVVTSLDKLTYKIGDFILHPRVIVGVASTILINDIVSNIPPSGELDMSTVSKTVDVRPSDVPSVNMAFMSKSIMPKPVALNTKEQLELLDLVNWTGSANKVSALANLAPVMQVATLGLARDFKKNFKRNLRIKSAFRSEQEQIDLINRKLSQQVGGANESSHRFGMAIDVASEDVKDALDAGLLTRHGLYQPIDLTGEYWHIESVFNVSRVDSVYFDICVDMAKKGYTGHQLQAEIVRRNLATPADLLTSVDEYVQQYAKATGNKTIANFVLKSFYIESRFGLHQISKTGALGHWQFTLRTARSLKLNNRLSLRDSLMATIKLAEDNVRGISNLKEEHIYMLHNLGKPSFINMVRFLAGTTELTKATLDNIKLQLPGSIDTSSMSDLETVRAYVGNVAKLWNNATIAVKLSKELRGAQI